MPAETDPLEPVQPWREAWLALPFALLTALAWRPWLPEWFVVALVLIVFCSRRFPATNKYAPWASVYAALPAVLVSADWLERLTAFFAGLVLGYLIGAALDGVALGSRWSWLAPLIVFVVWPSPWGALGGLGLALLGALENRRFRVRGDLGFVRSEALVALGLTGLAVAVLTVALTETGSNLGRLELGNLNRPASVSGQAPGGSKPSDTVRSTPSGAPPRQSNPAALEMVLLTVQVVLMVMVLLFGTVLLRMRLEGQSRGRSSLTDVMPIIGAFILMAALLAWTVLGRKAGPNDGLPPNNPQGTASGSVQERESTNNPVQDGLEQRQRETILLWLTAGMVVIVGLAGAYLLWKLRGLRDEDSTRLAITPTDTTPDRIEATNRVRAAYRAFLTLCASVGLPKATSETPFEFAQRMTEFAPDALEAAQRLTRRYEPVRYGQLSDADGALEAQTALAELRGILEPQARTVEAQ